MAEIVEVEHKEQVSVSKTNKQAETIKQPRHPAKYTNNMLPLFSDILLRYRAKNVLDPFAGTGKVALIKNEGFKGTISCCEIEKEWLEFSEHDIDNKFYCDSEFCDFGGVVYDAICTSPTYGNRMADHHNAKDGSKRNTYTHCIGHDLKEGNTGKMQWGELYKKKHEAVYKNVIKHLKVGGVFILNVSDHIRKGTVIGVSEWHKEFLINCGLTLVEEHDIETPRMRFGSNGNKRVNFEKVYVFVLKPL